MSKFIPQGMGWIPDLPDARDYTYRHDAVFPLLQELAPPGRKELPDKVDLRSDEGGEYFTSPDDQGHFNCCAACAVLSLAEYFERRVRGRTFDGSTLFLYKVTRNLREKRLRITGDTGADLRTTLKVFTSFGVPAEEYWPCDADHLDEEPSPFVYSLAKPFPGVHYVRLDESNRNGSRTWDTVKSFLAAGFPVVFGFSVPTSLTADANIPFRPNLDSIRGGQAAVAVGYRDHHFGRGQHALLIRSSWGSEWGDNGNAYLPVAYVRQKLARDFWTFLSDDWIDPTEFSRPTVVTSTEKMDRRS